jgi:hypothetical protein
MAKWADYAITSVHYNQTHDRIVAVMVRTDTGDTLENPQEISRNTVVTMISNGHTFITATKGSDGKWKAGSKVLVMGKFITTKPNETTKDNLGELPEF